MAPSAFGLCHFFYFYSQYFSTIKSGILNLLLFSSKKVLTSFPSPQIFKGHMVERFFNKIDLVEAVFVRPVSHSVATISGW